MLRVKTIKYVLGLDLGGSTRNGLCLMEKNTCNILRYSYIPYDSDNKLSHRNRVLDEIISYLTEFGDDIAIVFERINLYRGGQQSKLSNIISLCRIQTTIINNLSTIVPIYDIAVKTWKSRELGGGNATKEDSINMVSSLYPDIDLDILVKHVRKPDEIIKNHDLADAILIARACCEYPEILMEEHRLNFK